MGKGMPNLLDYYTILVVSTGVLQHRKVTPLGRPATCREATGPDYAVNVWGGQQEDQLYVRRVLSIRSPMALAK